MIHEFKTPTTGDDADPAKWRAMVAIDVDAIGASRSSAGRPDVTDVLVDGTWITIAADPAEIVDHIRQHALRRGF